MNLRTANNRRKRVWYRREWLSNWGRHVSITRRAPLKPVTIEGRQYYMGPVSTSTLVWSAEDLHRIDSSRR